MTLRYQSKKSNYKIAVTIILLILAIVVVRYIRSMGETSETPDRPSHQKSSTSQIPNQNKPKEYGIPQEAILTYKYALNNGGKARHDYRGNTRFSNREKRLPIKKGNITLNYKEYDIYPYVKGKNRGPERVVISSDKTGYYTGDHYRTFKQILK